MTPSLAGLRSSGHMGSWHVHLRCAMMNTEVAGDHREELGPPAARCPEQLTEVARPERAEHRNATRDVFSPHTCLLLGVSGQYPAVHRPRLSVPGWEKRQPSPGALVAGMRCTPARQTGQVEPPALSAFCRWVRGVPRLLAPSQEGRDVGIVLDEARALARRNRLRLWLWGARWPHRGD